MILTRASIPAQRSLRAVTALRVKTSRLSREGGVAAGSSPCEEIWRPSSWDGTGGGGGMEKTSSESCLSRGALLKVIVDGSSDIA